MNENSFLLVRAIRASDGGFRHEKHEGSLDPVLSCVPSCTDLSTKAAAWIADEWADAAKYSANDTERP